MRTTSLLNPLLVAALAVIPYVDAASPESGDPAEPSLSSPAGDTPSADAKKGYPADAVLYTGLHNGEEIALPKALEDAVGALNRELQPLVNEQDYLYLLKYELAVYLNSGRSSDAVSSIKNHLNIILRNMKAPSGNLDALLYLAPRILRNPVGVYANSSDESELLGALSLSYSDGLYSVMPSEPVSFRNAQLGSDTLFIALPYDSDKEFDGVIVERLSDSSCYLMLCPAYHPDVQPFIALVDPGTRDMQILGLMSSPEFFQYYNPDTGYMAQRFGKGWREALSKCWTSFVSAKDFTFLSTTLDLGWDKAAEKAGLVLPCKVDGIAPGEVGHEDWFYLTSKCDQYERTILMPDECLFDEDSRSSSTADADVAQEVSKFSNLLQVPTRTLDENGKKTGGFLLSTSNLKLFPYSTGGKTDFAQLAKQAGARSFLSDLSHSIGEKVTFLVDDSKARAGAPGGSSLYALVLPDGQYTGSPGCEDFLYVSDGKYQVGMAALAPWRNRPAEVLKALGGDPDAIEALEFMTERWLKKIGFDETRPEPSLADLPRVCSLELPYKTDQSTVMAKVRLEATKEDITKLAVSVDDVPIELPESATASLPIRAGSSGMVEFPLELVRGRNLVRVRAVDKEGTSGDSVAALVLSSCPAQPQRAFIVALGVSDYDREELKLAYAAKDAGDIAAVLSKLSERDEVSTLLLRDKEVTHDVLTRVGEFLAETKPSDIVYFYLAGHGMLDEKMDYYYAPCDFDPEQVSASGISMEMLLATLNRTAARKRLLLVDTCHAGELDEEEEDKLAMENAATLPEGVRAVKTRGMKIKKARTTVKSTLKKRYINEFFNIDPAVQGINVIAASAGTEFAQESGEWNNGVFTASLIRAFVGLDHADNNRDGFLTVPELYTSVRRNVLKLTGGAQNPTATMTKDAYYTPAAYSLYYGVPGENLYYNAEFDGAKAYQACNWPLLERKLELYRQYEQTLSPAYGLLMQQSIYHGATQPIVDMVCRSGFNPSEEPCFRVFDIKNKYGKLFLTQRAKANMKSLLEYTHFDAEFYRSVLKACEECNGQEVLADTPDEKTPCTEAAAWLEEVKARLREKIAEASSAAEAGTDRSTVDADDPNSYALSFGGTKYAAAWRNPHNGMPDELRLRQCFTELSRSFPGFIRSLSFRLEEDPQGDPAPVQEEKVSKPYTLTLYYTRQSQNPATPTAVDTVRYTATVYVFETLSDITGNFIQEMEVLRCKESHELLSTETP